MFLLSLQKENRAKIWLTLFPKKDRFVGYALSVFIRLLHSFQRNYYFCPYEVTPMTHNKTKTAFFNRWWVNEHEPEEWEG
ncbi:hypothetical protein [Capnocytophaga canis]|uniref:hypothetical protein n=1 Tax=Capnocytophaga canis TaxID=1848903 RepID=UPI0015622E62|nr:hypothetical protein [Capnocytophaga canis]